jgi:hypothetical protein
MQKRKDCGEGDCENGALITRYETALQKIAALRHVEDANEPFDEALDIADAALSSGQ